jgi:hypothetical protein
MSVYRINVYKTYDTVIKRKAFSAPSAINQLIRDKNDFSKWSELERIKKGNLVMLCRGIKQIWAIAYTTDDCRITDIDCHAPTMVYEENGFRFVSIEIYREFAKPIDGSIYFNNLLEQNAFEDTKYCVRLVPLASKIEEFNKGINELLQVNS